MTDPGPDGAPGPAPDAPQPAAAEPGQPVSAGAEPEPSVSAPVPVEQPPPDALPPAAFAAGAAPQRRGVTVPVAVPVTVALVLGLALGLILGWVIPRPGSDDSSASVAEPATTAPSGDVPPASQVLDPASPQPVPGGPDGTDELAGLVLGTEGPVVEVFEDYVCPFCARLELTSGATLRASALGGEFRLVIHPLAFLTEDSPRAANASACVYQHAEQEQWVSFHEAVYAQQDPSESVGQYATDVLLDLAAEVGVDSAEVTACIEDGTYTAWVAALTEQAFSRGVTGTPTVAVEGTITDPSPLLE